MPVAFIEDAAGGRRVREALAAAASVAVDCEAAGFPGPVTVLLCP